MILAMIFRCANVWRPITAYGPCQLCMSLMLRYLSVIVHRQPLSICLQPETFAWSEKFRPVLRQSLLANPITRR
jgi:hypothetical protein